MDKQKCALCSNCKVIIKAKHEILKPIATEDIEFNGAMFFDYCIQKYTNPGKIKKYTTCFRWKSQYSLTVAKTREMQKCDYYDPDDLDCDDNPIDVNQFLAEISKRQLLEKAGFKEKYQK